MLRYDDNGEPKLKGDDAVALINTLRGYAHNIKFARQNKAPRLDDALTRAAFEQKTNLLTAAAELERFYIGAGIIPDERIPKEKRKVRNMLLLYEVSRTPESTARCQYGEFTSAVVLAEDEVDAINIVMDENDFGTWKPCRDELIAIELDMQDEGVLAVTFKD